MPSEHIVMEDASGAVRQPARPSIGVITAKTAAYQLLVGDSGKTFTNRGAGASVTFTLPPLASCKAGMNFRIVKATPGQNVVIAPSGNTFVGPITPFTGTTAVTNAAANERGSCFLFFDGTEWLINPSGTWTIS